MEKVDILWKKATDVQILINFIYYSTFTMT